ncbi:hypothetical protein LT493_21885 [Streptomyces tricolor]|nr:hypothetical protein [Streptomyces tricolor]
MRLAPVVPQNGHADGVWPAGSAMAPLVTARAEFHGHRAAGALMTSRRSEPGGGRARQ